MGRRKRGEVPARLLRVAERFAAWRRTRDSGQRIPAALWKSAAKLAGDYGLCQTAAVLRLDYYSLKKHVERQRGDSAGLASRGATFVELPSPSLSAAGECVIEFEDATGASMRVHLKGTNLPDVVALGRSFWAGE